MKIMGTKTKKSNITDTKNKKTNKAKGKSILNGTGLTYVNVNRTSSGYKDKYKKDVDKAVLEFASKLGKKDGSKLTKSEWKKFFKTVLIPLDKASEQQMIKLFHDNRDELNQLLVLHNTLAGDNLAEVYYKKYEKFSPTRWHDLEDFKQMALEGLSIAAQRYDINSGNKFITFATWWVLNRVLHPTQEKGAKIEHTSLSSPVNPTDVDNTATLEDVFTPDMMASEYGGYQEETFNPALQMEKHNSEDNYDFYTAIRHTTTKSIEELDQDKVKEMTNYLVSLIEKRQNSYDDRQIFLYMFRKIFNKCHSLFKDPNFNMDVNKLNSYINEAARSKAELLTRLNMDEKEYNKVCQGLLRRGYDGI